MYERHAPTARDRLCNRRCQVRIPDELLATRRERRENVLLQCARQVVSVREVELLREVDGAEELLISLLVSKNCRVGWYAWNIDLL